MITRDRIIAGSLWLVVGASIAFVAAYAFDAGRAAEGILVALAAAGCCGAAVGWAVWIIPPEQVVDRHERFGIMTEEAAQDAAIRAGTAEITRRRALLPLLTAAGAAFGIALLTPLRSLGPRVDGVLFHTKWRPGTRLAREDGRLVHRDDLDIDAVTTVFPEHAIGDAQAQTMLLRVPVDQAAASAGYLAYSKVCTHAGCPVALYRAAVKQLMCPCHQSVFDVLHNGAVVSGPADHALPRLPLEIGHDGYLRAAGDFPEPVGPGFWERA